MYLTELRRRGSLVSPPPPLLLQRPLHPLNRRLGSSLHSDLGFSIKQYARYNSL